MRKRIVMALVTAAMLAGLASVPGLADDKMADGKMAGDKMSNDKMSGGKMSKKKSKKHGKKNDKMEKWGDPRW
jgi:pentapeptide MXKDX repeat protein